MPGVAMQQADIAVPDMACAVTKDEVRAGKDAKLSQDTSVIFAHSGPRAVRFVYDWITLHKHDLHRSDRLLRHDQVSITDLSIGESYEPLMYCQHITYFDGANNCADLPGFL